MNRSLINKKLLDLARRYFNNNNLTEDSSDFIEIVSTFSEYVAVNVGISLEGKILKEKMDETVKEKVLALSDEEMIEYLERFTNILEK